MPENVKGSRKEEFEVKKIAEAIGRVFPYYKVSVERGENEYKDRYVLYLKDPADNLKEYHLAHLFPKKDERTGESYYEAHVFPNVIIAADAFRGLIPISQHYTIRGPHPTSEHPPQINGYLDNLIDSIFNNLPSEIDVSSLSNLIDSMLSNLRDFLKYFDIAIITYPNAYNTAEPFILHLYKNDFLLRYR